MDALAAGRLSHLLHTVQLTDTGITPGSGVGNARTAIDREIADIARVIGYAIDLALHPHLSIEEIDFYLS